MKQLLLGTLLFCIGFAVSPEAVRELKAYDSSFKKTPITSGVWQNLSKQVVFEWKEPFSTSELKGYRYYFGPNSQGKPEKSLTETTWKSPELTEGKYYFTIAAASTDGSLSVPKTLEIYYDPNPLQNKVVAKAYADDNKNKLVGEASADINRPIISLELTGLKISGAELKGINIAWATNKSTPNMFINKNELTFQPAKSAIPGKLYYLIANVEDEAGNISEPKVVLTYTFTGQPENEPNKPNMSILNKSVSVQNENYPEDKSVVPGSTITYQISLNNQGLGNAYNVEISDVLPDNTTIVPGTTKSTKPAKIQYWDESTNGGSGAWTETIMQTNKVKKVRWLFTESFQPVAEQTKPQAILSYSLLVNQ